MLKAYRLKLLEREVKSFPDFISLYIYQNRIIIDLKNAKEPITSLFLVKDFSMKYKVPEEYQARFDTLIRSLPLELQNDTEFQEALLVHLKLGGMNLARHLAETTTKYLNVDVLEIGTGLRFPKVIDAKVEDQEDQADELDDELDDDDDEDDEDDEDDDE